MLILLMQFRDGKIWIEPFDVKMGKINTTVEGTTSFLQELDYKMEMEIPQSMFGGEAAGLLSALNRCWCGFRRQYSD